MTFWTNPWAQAILGGLAVAAILAILPWWRRRVRLQVQPLPPRDFALPDPVLESVDLPFLRLRLTTRSSATPLDVAVQAWMHPDRQPVRIFRLRLDPDGGGQLQLGTIQPMTLTFPHRRWREDLFVSVLEVQDFAGNQADEARLTLATVAGNENRLFRVRVKLPSGECDVWRWRP